MKTLTINLPNTADIDDKEAKMSLASKLYKRGKLTLGQAAELDEDIDNAQRYSIWHKSPHFILQNRRI